MTPQHRSYSQLNQLRTCGHQFKLERVDKVPRRPSTPAVAGKIIHKATEEIDLRLFNDDFLVTNREDLTEIGLDEARLHAPQIIAEDSEHFTPDQWKKYGRATLDKPNGEDLDWFLEHGIPQAISAYVDWRLENLSLFSVATLPDDSPAIEVEFFYRVGDELVKGYIDRVFQAETQLGIGYYVMDLKSGRKPDSTEQLGLYSAALKQLYGWDVHWGYYLYALKTGTAKLTEPLPMSVWTEQKLESIYVPASRMIEAGLFLPKPGEHCWRMCGVSHACEFFAAASV